MKPLRTSREHDDRRTDGGGSKGTAAYDQVIQAIKHYALETASMIVFLSFLARAVVHEVQSILPLSAILKAVGLAD